MNVQALLAVRTPSNSYDTLSIYVELRTTSFFLPNVNPINVQRIERRAGCLRKVVTEGGGGRASQDDFFS